MKPKLQENKLVHHRNGLHLNHLPVGKTKLKAKPQNIALTNKQKNMYPQFNLFELQLNRLAPLPEYNILTGEIAAFNQELEDWKKKNIQIKNIYPTYHLYINLFSRMQSTSNLFIDRNKAKKELADIATWFLEQKPKVRNKAADKQEGQLKPSTADRQTAQQFDRLLMTSKTKRDLQVYEAMSRTSHKQFFPPKERLLDYQQIIDSKQGLKQDNQTQRRAFSVNNLAKIQRYRGSFISTMQTFRRTTQNTKRQQINTPIVSPFKIRQLNQKELQGQSKGGKTNQLNEQQIKQAARQKTVVQQILLQQNIIQDFHQEDAQDEQYQLIFQQQKPQPYRKYKEHRNADDRMIAEQGIKDVRQSTLRRIITQKEEAIRNKMEDLNIAEKMANWAAVKSRFNSEQNRKSERRLLGNNYSQLQFVGKTFEQRQSHRKKDIPQYPLLYRSQSSQIETVEKKFQKLKIQNTLKKYGKYIKHIQIKPSFDQQAQIKAIKSSSLTHFGKHKKRSPFSKILDLHGVKKHNQQAHDNVIHVKQRLAKRSISVEKKCLMNAFEVLDVSKLQKKELFPQKSKLLSNPFFPKQAKPKKKK